MDRKLTLLVVLMSATFQAFAQLPLICPPGPVQSADFCYNACVNCNFDTYYGSTAGYSWDFPQSFPCGTVENNQWFGFIAGESTAIFTATPSNCVNGNGIQIAIYEACGHLPIECEGGGWGFGNTPVSVTPTLVPGLSYLIMIDGQDGDFCDFTLTVDPLSAVQAPPIDNVMSPIEGPLNLCPGQTATYTVPPVTNAGGYTWTVPSGWLINDHPSPVTVIAPDGNTVTITAGPNTGANQQICVQAVSPCIAGGPITCLGVNLQNIPTTHLEPVFICSEEAPFFLPWGEQADISGTYQTVFPSYVGCDSTVSLALTVRPKPVTMLPIKTVCSGECVMVCGQDFCASGNYQIVCESFHGCDSLINFSIQVLQPVALINGNNVLTCQDDSIMLVAAPSPSPTLFQWKNLAGQVIGDGQGFLVTAVGTYILTASMNGQCLVADTIVITGNSTAPTLTALGGNLSCTLDSVQLSASSNSPNPTWLWSGPNGFSSIVSNPIVSIPGTYTVTSSLNGCTGTAAVTVLQDIAPPGATATGNIIDCNHPLVGLTASSPVGQGYAWAGPNNFASNLQNPTVSNGGIYTVTVTGPNGCTSTANAIVSLDVATATLSAVAPDVLSCTALSVNIQSTVTTNGSALQGLLWDGPNNFSSTQQNPIATGPGVYTLTATTLNGCTATTTVTINQDIALPNASAQGATLTCADTAIHLNGISASPNVTFAWSGPNNFTSTLEDPTVTLDGTYALTVTGLNGCTLVVQAAVLLDTLPPDAATVSSNNLDCDELSATLTATSQTGGVMYAWTGPNNFSANTAVASTPAPGIYQVAVTAPNGCSSTSSVTVFQDIQAPTATATGSTIDCVSGQATLGGSSQTNGVTYAWTGPNNFVSNLQNPFASEEGQYLLTVTGPNGCTATATAMVLENTLSPQVTVSGGGTLTCTIPDVTIAGSIATAGATGVWTGPNNFNSTQDTITVSVPGIYTFTVTAQNGCVSAPTSTVWINTQNPQGVTAVGGSLNCTFLSINLAGNSSTLGVTYLWTGPGSFMSNLPNPPVTNPGFYTLLVTDPLNGCTASAIASVTQDPTVPSIAVAADSLTCLNPSVVLNATTNNPNVHFAWTGPNGFVSTQEDPTTSIPGAYEVVVTAISSGCSATLNYTVLQNVALPGVTAQGDTLTCTQTSGQIISSSNAMDVSYNWTGPAGFTSNLPNPNVTLSGTYTVVVTGTNGCSASAQVQVTPDINAPVVTASGGMLTCAITSITLTATANLGVSWLWSGPSNFSSTLPNPSVSAAGNYMVTATAPNSCVTSVGVTVVADNQSPSVNIETPGELGCVTLQVGLSATVAGTGLFTYLWSTTDGLIVSGANSLTPTVSQAGIYQLLVTNTSNGCTTVQAQAVVADDTPKAVEIQKREVACFGDTNGSATISAITGGTAPYLYSLDNRPFVPDNVFAALEPGTHSLVVQDINGCEYETSFEILEPGELIVDLGPDTTIHLGEQILISLENIVNYPDRVEQTVLSPADLPIDSIWTPSYSLPYRVTVIDSNGCEATDVRIITVDRTRWVYIPNVFNPASTENYILTVYGGPDVERIKSFRIFDRWGDAVYQVLDFEKNDLSKGWDGLFRGKEVNPGVFVYYAEVLFKDGELVLFKGDVTVVR